MYKNLPTFWRLANEVTHSVSWLFVAAAGVAFLLFPPSTITESQPLWMSIAGPTLLVLAALFAAAGAATGRYWWEAIGAFIAAAGFSTYALTIWSMIADTPTRGTQAFAVTAVVAFMVGRAVVCATRAHKVRAAYENPPEA